MQINLLSSLTFIALVGLASCTQDALPEPTQSDCPPGETPTYAAEVALIIEETCAYSGCHLGGAPGVYNDYNGLLADLESGRFRERVITLRDDPNVGMPPNYAPAGRPEDLTAEQLRTIECWLAGGFPED